MKGERWARVMGSWPILRARSWPYNRPSSYRTAGAFRGEFSHKKCCSSLCNLTFDRIVKKLSGFEGRS